MSAFLFIAFVYTILANVLVRPVKINVLFLIKENFKKWEGREVFFFCVFFDRKWL